MSYDLSEPISTLDPFRWSLIITIIMLIPIYVTGIWKKKITVKILLLGIFVSSYILVSKYNQYMFDQYVKGLVTECKNNMSSGPSAEQKNHYRLKTLKDLPRSNTDKLINCGSTYMAYFKDGVDFKFLEIYIKDQASGDYVIKFRKTCSNNLRIECSPNREIVQALKLDT